MTDATKTNETPLTDEQLTKQHGGIWRSVDGYQAHALTVPAMFARSLERQLNAATALVATEKERADKLEIVHSASTLSERRDLTAALCQKNPYGAAHEWEMRHDWAGDPSAINGTRTWQTAVCRWCAVERQELERLESGCVPEKTSEPNEQTAALLSEREQVKELDRWIPVSEQPAPTKGLIDVWNNGTRFTGCYWDHVCREHRCIQAGHLIRLSNITYWMRIPAPPAALARSSTQPQMSDAPESGVKS